jgi:hypothetical protein
MRRAGVLALALSVVACATITRGTNQNVAVNTPGVAGATCMVSTSVGPQTVVTPGTVSLAKGSASLPVHCTKQCYQDGAGVIASTIEPMTAGNLIVGGAIGIGVDAVSGAMNKYPDEVAIVMIPIPGCGAPAGRRR